MWLESLLRGSESFKREATSVNDEWELPAATNVVLLPSRVLLHTPQAEDRTPGPDVLFLLTSDTTMAMIATSYWSRRREESCILAI